MATASLGVQTPILVLNAHTIGVSNMLDDKFVFKFLSDASNDRFGNIWRWADCDEFVFRECHLGDEGNKGVELIEW